MPRAICRDALICAIAALVATLSPALAQEVLTNSGFEAVEGERAADWSIKGPVRVTRPGRDSDTALDFQGGGRTWQCLALEAGWLYHASVWAKGAGDIRLAFYEYTDGPGQGYASSTAAGATPVTEDWRRYDAYYSKGPNEAQLNGLCFVIAVGGEGAQVAIDDASVLRSAFPDPPPNLLPEGFADADGDELPDGWQGEPRRLSLRSIARGITAVRCDTTLFADAYLPAADFADWWSWSRWGEQHGSGWPALPRPLGGAYTVLLASDPVAVDPGRRYDVGLLLRHREVYGEFVGVRWFDDEMSSSEFSERIGYSYQAGYTGDWQRYTGRVTSPLSARHAAVVVGCKLSSGAIEVAMPSLTPGLGAPGRHEPRSERGPAPVSEGPPEVERGRPEIVRARTYEAGVHERDGVLVVAFENGVSVEVLVQDGMLRGIGEVSCDGMPLRSRQAPPLAPVVETAPGREHVACSYDGWDEQAGAVVIRSTLRAADGSEDALEWVLAPTSAMLGGREYKGLRYGYRVRSDAAVRRVMDRATWTLGGDPMGLEVGERLAPIGPSSAYCLTGAYRYVGGESFDYQTGAAGTLVGMMNRYHTSLFMRAATPEFVILQDTFLFPEVSEANTTMKSVLYCPEPGGADDWARVRDEMYANCRRQLDAPPETPLEPAAMIIGWARFRGIGDLHAGELPEGPEKRAAYFRWVADEVVPQVAELGFKRLMIVLGMSPWDWPRDDLTRIPDEYVESFRALCDAAHEHGVEMIAWYATGRLEDGAAAWEEHPEFVIEAPGGGRTRVYYSPEAFPAFLPAGFDDYSIEGLAQARERTGLDGLWLDSWAYATHLLNAADFTVAVRQADALLPWHARIEALGYLTVCEGNPHSIGTQSSGWRPPEDWSRFRAETRYKSAPYMQQPYGEVPSDSARFLTDERAFYYYRMLANRCCPILDLGHFGNDMEAMERIAAANRDFNAVADLMQRRRLLGEDGVEWISPQGRAVFAYRAMRLPAARDARVTDVTTGKPVAAKDGWVELRAYHTYRVE